jgi:hypothetical protein
VTELVLDELHRVAVLGQGGDALVAVGQHQRVEQEAGLVLERRVGVERVAVGGRHAADARADEPGHRALLDQRGLHRRQRGAVHAGATEQRDLPALQRAVAGPAKQRKRGRLRHLRLGGRGQRQGSGSGSGSIPGPSRPSSPAPPRRCAAWRTVRSRIAGTVTFESSNAERVGDVVLLHRRLALEEEPAWV